MESLMRGIVRFPFLFPLCFPGRFDLHAQSLGDVEKRGRSASGANLGPMRRGMAFENSPVAGEVGADIQRIHAPIVCRRAQPCNRRSPPTYPFRVCLCALSREIFSVVAAFHEKVKSLP